MRAFQKLLGKVARTSVQRLGNLPLSFLEVRIYSYNSLEGRLNAEESHTRTVRDSWRCKTKRKKSDGARSEFGCLSALLPELTAEKLRFISTISEEFGCTHSPHALCTPVISFFPCPPWLRVKIVDLSCCSWRISTCTRCSLRELSQPPSEAQLPLCWIFPICLQASLFQGVGYPTNIQSVTYLTTQRYCRYHSVIWFQWSQRCCWDKYTIQV